jgi:hypothetical protein
VLARLPRWTTWPQTPTGPGRSVSDFLSAFRARVRIGTTVNTGVYVRERAIRPIARRKRALDPLGELSDQSTVTIRSSNLRWVMPRRSACRQHISYRAGLWSVAPRAVVPGPRQSDPPHQQLDALLDSSRLLVNMSLRT